MTKILTFDCYGTLLNTDPLYETIHTIAASHLLPAEKARTIFTSYEDRLMYGGTYIPYDQVLKEALEYCDMELNTQVFQKEWRQILQIHNSFEPYPDVLEALRYLKEQGYTLILMSNTIHTLMNAHLKKLENLFDDVLLAEDCKCYKPDLRFFQLASVKFKLNETEHWHIAKGYWWDIVPCSCLRGCLTSQIGGFLADFPPSVVRKYGT